MHTRVQRYIGTFSKALHNTITPCLRVYVYCGGGWNLRDSKEIYASIDVTLMDKRLTNPGGGPPKPGGGGKGIPGGKPGGRKPGGGPGIPGGAKGIGGLAIPGAPTIESKLHDNTLRT